MGWYALEEIDEAIEQSKDMLLPFDLSTWVKLGIILIFTGQGMNFPSMPSGSNSTGTYQGDGVSTSPMSMDMNQDVLRDIVPQVSSPESVFSAGTLFVVIAAVIIIGALWFIVSSIFEFIFYQSLIDRKVHIRKNFRKHFRAGLQYFTFQLLIFLIILLPLVPIGFMAEASVWAAIGAGLIWILALLPLLAILLLTHNLVLPHMITEDLGIIGAWRSLYPELRAEYDETFVYLLTRVGLSLVTGVLSMFVIFGLLLFAGIPFMLIGIALSTLHNLLAVFAVLGFLATFLTGLFAVMIPIQVFMYHHALLVSEDFFS